MDYEYLLKYICHRKPERSFFIKGYQFPVCSRCTGIYISMISYVIYAYLIPIHYTLNYIYYATLLVIPCFVDGFSQIIGIRESNNTLRFVTGLLAGIGIMVILKFVKLLLWR